jgi:diguanylate cyclase (GGDEF)-like protein
MNSALNFLLVEDDPVDALAIQRGLDRCGLHKCTDNAVTLEQAKERIRHKRYDAVILDLGLPDSSGIDGVLEFQASAPEIPIVVLTGNLDDSVAMRSMDIGAEDFIQKKSLTDEALCRALRFAIERHRRKRQAYSDLDAMRLSLNDAMRRATTDQLTNLPNRRGLQNHIEQVSRRYHYHPVIVGICDLDHFKNINDTYGHHVGDAVLSEFAGRLQHCLRSTDFAARIGGDEFVIVFGGMSREEAAALGRRMLAHVSSSPAMHAGLAVPFSATLALAEVEAPFIDMEQILSQTHAMLTQGKEGGRNRVQCSWNCELPSKPNGATGEGAGQEESLELDKEIVQLRRSVNSIQLGASLGNHLAFGLGSSTWPMVGPLISRARLANRLSEITLDCLRLAQRWRSEDAPHAMLHLDIEADAINPLLCAELVKVFPEESSRGSCVLFLHTDFPSMPGSASFTHIRLVRQAGFQLGVRNLGDGATIFEHLQLLNPSWIRLDPALTINVGRYQKKVEHLRQVVDMLRPLGALLVAEETEDDLDLRQLLELGFHAYYSRTAPAQNKYSLSLKAT